MPRAALAAALAAAIALGVAPVSRVSAAPDKARKAPSLTLKTLDGRNVKLADLKGRVVLVDFWASWCAPCKETFPALDTLAGEMQDRVDVLAVSEDEKRKDLEAFLAASAPRLKVLLDPRGDAAGAFGVTAIPSIFVIDAGGMIRFAHPGYSIDDVAAVRGELEGLSGR